MKKKVNNHEISKVRDLFGINKKKINTEKALKEIDKLFDF